MQEAIAASDSLKNFLLMHPVQKLNIAKGQMASPSQQKAQAVVLEISKPST